MIVVQLGKLEMMYTWPFSVARQGMYWIWGFPVFVPEQSARITSAPAESIPFLSVCAAECASIAVCAWSGGGPRCAQRVCRRRLLAGCVRTSFLAGGARYRWLLQ